MSAGEPQWYNDLMFPDKAIDERKTEIEHLKRKLMEERIRNSEDELKRMQEEVLREKNPTVKDAWEKYQIALKLVQKDE